MPSNRLLVLMFILSLVGCSTRGASSPDGVSDASSIDSFEKLVWKVDANASQPPNGAGALRIVSDRTLHTVDDSDGTLDEGVELSETPSTPFVVAEGLLFYGARSTLVAASLHEAKPAWTVKLPRRLVGAPVVADDAVFVAAADVFAFDPVDGAEIWRYDADVSFAAQPAVRDGVLYAATDSGQIHAVDVATGQKRWVYEAQEPFAEHVSPAVGAELVIAVGRSGSVFAVFRDSGREKWRFRSGDVVSTRPAIHDARVFVGTEAGAVIAVNARTGQEVWRREELAAIVTPMTWSAKKLHLGTDDGVLHALSAADGQQKWSFELEAEPLGAPLLGNGEVIAADRNGRLYLIE